MDATKIIVGYDIVGKAFNGDADSIVIILLGTHDFEIALAFAQTYAKVTGQPADPLSHEVVTALANLKHTFRKMLFEELEQEKKKNHEELVRQLRNSNKPHPLGTVSQIAEKFNISKSEVRRRKADGTLGELFVQGNTNVTH